MHSYAGLTDHDFELLVADLLGTDESRSYEVFARGPDLGVDLRFEDDDCGWHVVQCKHYTHSTMSTLRRDARKEARKLARLTPAPASYRFVTSRRLTPGNKRDLKADLAPFIRRQAHILGEDDLELLLGRHAAVERRHIKLWLPSSAQLQTLMAAATYSRSKAMAEQIRDLLPRWVSSHAFFEARDMLRRGHVCVIAGVPGIGKTTLAKILLADAINDGYEPVWVSADIDEANDVWDATERHVFYYDDFLGREALTRRLVKNEEDRLLEFMRRVTASKTKLFVLTTREYILQQAGQLYDQLAVEGIEGRKFLLELDGYTRSDRARIFYNHAFSSGQLSRGARRALLKDRAYEAVIDHPAYNPRQIEWITGLAGHELTEADNADYVGFAVAALDDPIRVWRHGFEHQLDDAQRALLLALASMPNDVEHHDVQRAFEGFCAAAGISTRGRAFETALKVLDDSFVRSDHDRDSIFVTVYNPSVADFLLSYFSTSPTDAILAVRGAAFFEQVEKLGRLARTPELSPALSVEYVDAVERCFDAPSCSWWEVYFGRDATRPTTTRRRASPEDRVDVIGQMKTWPGPYREEPIHTRIRDLYTTRKKAVRAAWAEGRGEPNDVLRLLRAMQRRGEGIQAFAIAAKTVVTSNLHYPQAFGSLLALRDLAPTIFEADEWAGLRRAFFVVADEELTNWHEMRDADQVDDIERYANRMDVDLDGSLVREARELLEERIAEAEERAEEESDEREVEDEPELEDADAEIEAMFIRLADD